MLLHYAICFIIIIIIIIIIKRPTEYANRDYYYYYYLPLRVCIRVCYYINQQIDILHIHP